MVTKIAGKVENNNPGNIDVPYSNGNNLAAYLASLSYGIYAESAAVDLTVKNPLKLSVCRLVAEDRFKDSDLVVILGGRFGPQKGASYIEISSAENFRQNCGHL